MSLPHAIYLHGFASGPDSRKAAVLGQALAGHCAGFSAPALDGGNFTAMTMDAVFDRAAAAVSAAAADGAPCLVIGSSLGGYTAALLADRGRLPGLGALLLLAPAFGFVDRWRQLLGRDGLTRWRRDGSYPFFHHGAAAEVPLGVGFLESCRSLPSSTEPPAAPMTVIHGRADQTVPWRASFDYALRSPTATYHLLADGHALDSAAADLCMCTSARFLADALREVA